MLGFSTMLRPRASLLRCVVPALFVASFATAAPAPKSDDAASLLILQYGRPVGREDFTITTRPDSVILKSKSTLSYDPAQPERVKYMECVLRADNWVLLGYTARQTIQDVDHRVSIIPGPDTTLTVYKEQGVNGVGDTYYRPPGRLYVLDAMMYSLFQVMTQSLGPLDFSERTISVVTVGARDTVVEARIRKLPDESIRWGNKPMTAHKLRFEQGALALDVWTDTRHRVLRITHEPSGLAVERKAPAVKAAAKPKPKPGG
jgi:hypothetical protein